VVADEEVVFFRELTLLHGTPWRRAMLQKKAFYIIAPGEAP
jgi:hypothetical protein